MLMVHNEPLHMSKAAADQFNPSIGRNRTTVLTCNMHAFSLNRSADAVIVSLWVVRRLHMHKAARVQQSLSFSEMSNPADRLYDDADPDGS